MCSVLDPFASSFECSLAGDGTGMQPWFHPPPGWPTTKCFTIQLRHIQGDPQALGSTLILGECCHYGSEKAPIPSARLCLVGRSSSTMVASCSLDRGESCAKFFSHRVKTFCKENVRCCYKPRDLSLVIQRQISRSLNSSISHVP